MSFDSGLTGDRQRESTRVASEIRAVSPRAILLAVLIIGIFATTARSQSPSGTDWIVGKQLDQAILLNISGSWEDATLREQLMSISRRHRIAVFLDRRVDPSTRLDFSAINVTFEQFLWRLADQLDLGVCRFENLYYLGPRETTNQLPMLLDATRDSIREKLDSNDWKKVRANHWRRLATPYDILDRLAKSHDLHWENLETIEHDLWPEVDLPTLSSEAGFGVVLAGMGKWFEVNNGTTLKLVDFPELKSGTAEISGVENASQFAKAMRKQFPEANVRGAGKSLTIKSTPEQFAAIKREVVKSQQVVQASLDRQVYDLQTTAKRISILQHLAKQTNLAIEFDPELGEVLGTRVEISVRRATVDEIIGAVLKDSGLEYRIEAQTLWIIKP